MMQLWVAPEITKGGNRTAQSDIYSFGVLMSEMVNETLPYEEIDNKMSISYMVVTDPTFRPAIAQSKLEQGLSERERTVRRSQDMFLDLMRKCWEDDPHQRPHIGEVITKLKEVKELVRVSE